MTVDQDTTQDPPGGGLSMHTGWFRAGRQHYLPQHQAMMLCMLFGTATVRKLRGNVDEVLQQVFDDEPGAFFGGDGDTLASPVAWMTSDARPGLRRQRRGAGRNSRGRRGAPNQV
ncbi:DUF6042 family protein [Streptomyces sp. NPDC000410]|uniref:DUF6042 family protein n=1 Tax=Streptomyces sp. NPDC000410 TaxID=3154254 RepID=UPI00331DA7EE